MDPLILHNDRILSLEDAHLSPGQMGLLMGWGIFTTLRIYEGFPFAFNLHWARMTHDAQRLGVPWPYRQDEARAAIVRLAAANHRPEAMARVSFVKNHGGLWAEPAARPPTDFLVFTRELVQWPAVHRLKLHPHAIYSPGRFAGAKMISWVQNAAVLEQVHAEGFDDALLLNERGHIAECTSANFFAVRGRSVLTPPLSSGCLPGITREVLREVVPSAGYEFFERNLTPEDLSAVDEVFITSTTREVAAVGPIRPDWNFPAPGSVTQALEEAFGQYVKSHLDRTPA